MKKIHKLAEIQLLENNEKMVRFNEAAAYIRNYDEDGFRFHVSNTYLSEWFETVESCVDAAIDYLFSNSDVLFLLEKFIQLLVSSPWTFRRSSGRLTIVIPSGDVAVVNKDLKIIHATDADIQCGVYGFIESVKPYQQML